MSLAMGANAPLSRANGEVRISHRAAAGLDVNLTAFLLTANNRVRSDGDMVFFNAPAGADGCATYHPPQTQGDTVEHRLTFDLSRVPAGVEKILITLSEDTGKGFAQVSELAAAVTVTGVEAIVLAPVPAFSTERGIMVAEVYVRNGQNKVRAVWQGYASGLAGLATAHGVAIDEAPPAPAAAPPAPAAPPPVPPPPAAPSPTPAISMQKVTGQVSLKKGDKPVMMEKTPLITASVAWRSGTDYDVYALVMTRDGKQIDVATFGAKGVKPLPNYGNGAVRHTGDVRRGSGSLQTESVEIKLTPEILAVVPVAYSAQSNGTGSFHRYKVALSINNHAGTEITISAENANNDEKVYSCVPGVIRNSPNGVVVEPLELYSARGSEKRPKLERKGTNEVSVLMDRGPVNKYK